ncbi:MAG: uL15m family ribosomal protein [Candidatus Paceibacterota bacterium]
MQLNDIQRNHPNKTSRQVGRGGKRGKTSGRGHKGQKARAGHSLRPQMRDEMKRLPKLRGRSTHRLLPRSEAPLVINLDALQEAFQSGETVSPDTLTTAGLVSARRKAAPTVKILGRGDIQKKLTVSGCQVSTTAREKIVAAGGTIQE